MLRKTKIVCTLGPSTDDENVMRSLIEEGMNVARFNFSHGGHEEQFGRLTMLRKLREEMKRPVAALLDTKGPEIRLKEFASGKVELKNGQTFTLTTEDIVGDESRVAITYKDLPDDVKPGDTILIDDGLIGLEVQANQYLDNRAGLICGEDTAAQIDKEVLAIINHAYDEAIRLLTENREVLDHIAEYLYEHETITGKEFMKIFRELKGIPEPEDEAEKKTFFEQAEEARQELEEGKTAAESQNMDDVLLRNTQDHEEQ